MIDFLETLLEYDGSINQRIYSVRKNLGLSQKKFAENANLSQAHLGLIETGKRKVNNRIVKLLCTSYGINENWLLSGSGSMFDDENNARLNRIFENFKKLDPLSQEYVLKQIDLYLEMQEKQKENQKAE